MGNRVLEMLGNMERSKLWLAKKIGMFHQTLEYKIDHDTFTAEEKERVKAVQAEYSTKPVDELFPEPDPSPEVA